MSYDLLVFAPESAPPEREAFIAWYEQQTEWEEDHSYDDPAISKPSVSSWFMEMIQIFPAMNGPFKPTEWPAEDSTVTDYSVGRNMIYAAFAWSVAEQAYDTAFSLAGKYQLGFYDVSSEAGEVWLPNGAGTLSLAHSE